MNEQDNLILQLARDVSYIKGTLIGDMNTMKENIKSIENKLEKESEKSSEKISKIFELESRLNNMENQLKQQKNSNTWIVRFVSGTVIAIAISAFVWLLTGQTF